MLIHLWALGREELRHARLESVVLVDGSEMIRSLPCGSGWHFKREERPERNSGRFLGDPVFWLSAGLLGTSLIFGGATRQGLISEAVPELLSLPLVALAIPRATPFLKRFPSAAALLVGLIILPCLQLVPLPPALWSVLPGRGLITEILTTAQVPMSWRPISLIPVETGRALLSLLPAIAIFLATLSLERGARRRLLLLSVAIGVASAVLAMLQVLGGHKSPFYFYADTNFGKGVGVLRQRKPFRQLRIYRIASGSCGAGRDPSSVAGFSGSCHRLRRACIDVRTCAYRVPLGHDPRLSFGVGDASVCVEPRARPARAPARGRIGGWFFACTSARIPGLGAAADFFAIWRADSRRRRSMADRRKRLDGDIELLSCRRRRRHVS